MTPFIPPCDAMEAPLKERVCAIFVTYHPDQGFPERFARVAPQVGGAIIVDNGSNAEALAMLRELAASRQSQLIDNGANLGIAAALNLGVRAAQQMGFAWVICFDQDSAAADDLVQELGLIYRALPDPERVALLGANSVDPGTGIRFLKRCPPTPSGFLPQTTVITSGSMMPVALWRRLGGFREEFFIDHVDHEFCLKARRHGYRVYSSTKVLMEHSIGSYQLRSLLGVKLLCLNHSPLRWYYIVRNFMVLLREYAAREPLWLGKTLLYFSAFLVAAGLYEAERGEKLRQAWAGLVDGCRGKMGPRRQGR